MYEHTVEFSVKEKLQKCLIIFAKKNGIGRSDFKKLESTKEIAIGASLHEIYLPVIDDHLDIYTWTCDIAS